MFYDSQKCSHICIAVHKPLSNNYENLCRRSIIVELFFVLKIVFHCVLKSPSAFFNKHEEINVPVNVSDLF